jgi:hypothetical protein
VLFPHDMPTGYFDKQEVINLEAAQGKRSTYISAI